MEYSPAALPYTLSDRQLTHNQSITERRFPVSRASPLDNSQYDKRLDATGVTDYCPSTTSIVSLRDYGYPENMELFSEL